ncbi:reverse transcriptase family protein [Iodobacter fluviatilis]|uniref:RNA-directed DNA polymerase n=1 Tax=Iodobacter fluviatilis TaxID=537 RepID=A0A377QAY0_9NEIS|nr:reverse transcriptase family protein [Iodobacter fluviatilis]TCU83733.1 RNA-directed DNA polymerase [Iodobacter fluviatilis]STQ91759.1 Retron-type reverse transcriptase [Iodobacter fluviatilis]
MLSNADLLELVKAKYKTEKKINLYAEYISKLEERSVPVIFSFYHFSDILGISPKTLRAMSFDTHLFYKSFEIPKRSGGIRNIYAPYPSLESVQRWILTNILEKAFCDFLPMVVGYQKNKSIKDHVSPHASSECILKFDLKNFFPSILFDHVYLIFKNIGYCHSVSKILSSLVTFNGSLPQGASTSPCLSNIYMKIFDAELTLYCEQKGFFCTRYADDIAVSGGVELINCLKSIKKLFNDNGLSLNHAKTKVYDRAKEVRFLTGLVVNKGVVRIPKEMRRRIRAQCHLFIKEIDCLVSNLPRPEYKLPSESWKNKELVFDPIFPERILGKLNFWLFIEPDDKYALSMKKMIEEKLNEIV